MWSIILFLLQFISKKNITFKEKDLWLIFEQLFKKWANPGLFFYLFSSFQTHITIFTTNKCEKMSIHYTVLGFELTTFGT